MLLDEKVPPLLAVEAPPPRRRRNSYLPAALRSIAMPFRRAFTVALLLSVLIVLYIWNGSTMSGTPVHPPLDPESPRQPPIRTTTCPMDAGYLKQHHDLTSEVVYHKNCIRPVFDESVDRDDVVTIPENKLFSQGQILDLGRPCQDWQAMPCESIDLRVTPPYEELSYPEFTFGVATRFERLIDSIPQFSQWLSDSGARLVAVVVDLDEHVRDIGYLEHLYKSHGIDLVICGPFYKPLGVNEQHFTIVRDLLRHRTPSTKWLGIIDDDTFFPSLYPLAEIMDYQDHTVPAYLGALSDSLDAIRQHGTMAYGGAGAFLSLPLAEQIEPAIEECLENSNSQQGDALLRYCIDNHSDAGLTILPGLNQADLMGNVDGFYESGRLPVSLHHWKSWHQAPVEQIAKASTFCGDCLLQRWRFGNDTVLNNGYSITVFSEGITPSELNKTEATFEYSYLYEWSHGPLREKAKEGTKKSYHLLESEFVGESLRQVYVHRARDGKMHYPDGLSDGASARDEVLELWWEG